MIPMPNPPTTIGNSRSGKYGMVRVRVDPKSIAPSTNSPPPMMSQRGAICGASRAVITLPRPRANANGMNPIPACRAE